MEDGGSPSLGFILFLIFIIIMAVFCGFGEAVQNLNRGEVEKKGGQGNKRAVMLLQIMDHPRTFTILVQLIMVIISLVLGYFWMRQGIHMLTELFSKSILNVYFSNPVIQWVSSIFMILLFLVLLLTFGMMIPKKLALHNTEKWAFGLVVWIRAVTVIFRPLTYIIDGSANLMIRLFGIDPNEDVDDVTEEEIILMVNEGHEHGVIMKSEAEMINNIFEFADKEAKDIMTHRKNIAIIECNQSLEEALNFMLEGNNSRFPVCSDGDLDDIIGIVHLKDAMKYHTYGEHKHCLIKDMKELIRPAVFIPETRNINLLFKSMQSRKIPMVIIVDEYGQTAGILTMEDILEEIVGNIWDEYDEDQNFIIKQEDNSYLMDGRTPIEEVEETLHAELEEEDYDTLNGFLISILERIPSDGEQLEITAKGFNFKILCVESKMIQKVCVTNIPEDIKVSSTEER